jgi:hypothetical protein
MKIQKRAASILLLITFLSPAALCQSPTPSKGKPEPTQVGKLSPFLTEVLAAKSSAWQTSWGAFLTLVEQELNRASPSKPAPWEGKEVTWEGTVRDMEITTPKNLNEMAEGKGFVRFVFDMPERTLSIKGNPVTANTMMIFAPMTYENLGAAQKGAKVRFKTTIAPIDANHPSVSVPTSKESGKAFLLIFTKGGAILK